jgi:chain length determinant protein tyrosine kinase EpsG
MAPTFRGARLSEVLLDHEVEHRIDADATLDFQSADFGRPPPGADMFDTPLNEAAPAARRIGLVLVEAGKLSEQDAEEVAQAQLRLGQRFGEAAITLGLVNSEDVRFALAQQFKYPYLRGDNLNIDPELVAALRPNSAAAESLRLLRSQLLLHWFNGRAERRCVAVCSAGPREGRTWLAANLAVVFAQLGARTLLVDANLRRPRVHSLFKLPSTHGLSTALSERGDVLLHQIDGLRDLSVLAAGPTPPNPQELLSRSVFSRLLDDLRTRFDVILIDTPPSQESADALLMAARAGGALVLARKNDTRARPLQEFAERLRNAHGEIVGSVMSER